MKWRGRPKSRNIDDRRNVRLSATGQSAGGLLRLLPLIFRFLGVKGTLLLVVGIAVYALFTGNLHQLLAVIGLQSPTAVTATEPLRQTAEEKELVDFISVVLADTEITWSAIFEEKGLRYQEPRLVLFRGAVKSACGLAQSAVGPFYCPGDQQVYIDLGFYEQLKSQLNAPGDFAQAYVIAHEVGHHVQTLLGISQQVYDARRQASDIDANKLSVLQELQADCFAGIWAHHANYSRQLLDDGDIKEALQAASAIGDDTLQKRSQGYVSPDSFTHGSAAQRVQWFTTGFHRGELASCNTFQ